MSRYDLFRRRIAPIAFIVAIALMARDSCNKDHRIHAAIVLELGAAAPSARTLDADVWMGGDRVAAFHREALAGGALGRVKIDASLPGKDGELRVDVDLGARHRQITRRFHAEDGSTVMIDLASDLRARREKSRRRTSKS